MCYCLLSGLMLFCALQGRGCYERRRGKTEDVLFFMWLQCVASMYCQWMYVSVCVFVIVLCLQGIGPRGPDSRPQSYAEPTFTKPKRFGAMWYREIIVDVVVFVSICWSSSCWCCLCLCQFQALHPQGYESGMWKVIAKKKQILLIIAKHCGGPMPCLCVPCIAVWLWLRDAFCVVVVVSCIPSQL